MIKASGLAPGKGVLLPDTRTKPRQALRAILVEREFGAPGAR